jgi:zinc transport system ATP-binding protein
MIDANSPHTSRADPGDAPLIAAIGLGLDRSDRTLLDNVSLSVRRGQVVVVIGPNGAGKTSLLRVLLGLWPASRGRVQRQRRLRIGYMPQRVQVDPILPLSVRRFLTLRHRLPRTQLVEWLREVGVPHLLEAPLQSLSGGELQRVLLARALLGSPDLLVLDEPDQGVDVVGQAEVFDLIDRLRQRTGCGVLMVSHELHLVMAAADVVVCLNQHVCCTGRPEEVSRHPEYQRLFPETGLHGIGIYTHHHNHVHDLNGVAHPVHETKEQPPHAG